MIETWSFRHPEHGLIEVKTGLDEDFREIYPDWPESGGQVTGSERLKKQFGTRTVVLLDGQVTARLEQASNTRALLVPTSAAGWTTNVVVGEKRNKPHVQLFYGFTKSLQDVYYREGEHLAEFTPPAGSRAEKRRQAMDANPIKRLLYPVLGGMGKAAWAIFVLVVLPLFGKLFDWVFDILPPIPWPDMPDLPPLPPLPELPHIDLPVLPPIPRPDIPWPNIHIPQWVGLVAEYKNVWMPIVIGVVMGILALRRSRQAREQRERWEEKKDYSASQPMSSMEVTEKPPAP